MERFKVAGPRFETGEVPGRASSAAPTRPRFDAAEPAAAGPGSDGGAPVAPGAAAGSWPSYLNCPSCGLSLRVQPAHLAIVHCPRCAGRGGRLAPLRAAADPDAPAVLGNRALGPV